MLNRIFVVDSVTMTSTGSSVVRVVPFDKTINKLPTQVVVKATGQGAYVRLSADGSAATSADVYVQAGDHVVMSVQGRSYVAALSDGASSTVSVGALSTGISGAYTFTPLELFGSAQGVWYDPSDASTLFSDTAGTTPSPTPGGGALSVVGRMLDKSGNGNHAISYNTTTARPELSARVNLLTYSEQFDNAYWLNYQIRAWGSGSVANATTAPDGTTTADLAVENTANDFHVPFYKGTIAPAGSYTFSVYAKAYAGSLATRYLALRIFIANNNFLYYTFDLASTSFDAKAGSASTFTNISASSTDVGNGWRRLALTFTCTGTIDPIGTQISNVASPTLVQLGTLGAVSYTGDNASGIYIWGADLRPTNIGASVPSYQRIADQYTYDSNGFPRYLVFNGTASGMYTPANLNLSATDKVTVFSGVRKLSDAAAAVLTELSAAFGSNNGSFAIFAPDSAAAQYYFGLQGTTVGRYIPTGFAAPITNVLSVGYNIGAATLAAEITPRINGVLNQSNPSASDAGTGNFGTYPLYIGSRNNAGSWLNGYLYSLIIVGAASTAAQISSTESWINVKEGTVY